MQQRSVDDRFRAASASSQTGAPEAVRMCSKAERSLSSLRDVNVCRARPLDLIAHQGFAVLITDTRGRITGRTTGFYLHQTRFLSRLGIDVNNGAPQFVSANVVDHHFISAYHFAATPAGSAASPKFKHSGQTEGELVTKGIELQVNAFVGGGLHLDLIVTNHGMADTAIDLSLDLAADFADFDEALEGKRRQEAVVERAWHAAENGPDSGGTLTLRYTHPGLDLASGIRLSGGDAWIDAGDRLVCRMGLRARQTRLIAIDLAPHRKGQAIAPFYGVDGAFDPGAVTARARREWAEGCARLATPNAVVQTAWNQAVTDLASLQTGEGRDNQPAMIVAGIPNYTGLFGRDAYLTALQTAVLNPATLRGTLQVLTPLNATAVDDFRDAEPGKVLHQQQGGPLAELNITPFAAYYGDQSAPGLFLLAAARHYAQTGDGAFLRSLKDKLGETLAWMAGNADELGFYPYQTRSSKGVKNQSWKDAGNAVLYTDGTEVPDPIAMADIQGLFYAAKQALGLAYAELGDAALSGQLLDEAASLKRRFNDVFWMPDERYYAIALDPDKQQVRSIASDPGNCLAYGIVDDDKTQAVVDRLMAEDMFSGWGIRTLSDRHPAYNPFAYHLGAVWPSPNSLTASGFKRYGFDDALFKVVEGLFAASQIFELDRLPEVFAGHPRDARHPHPGLYPGACSPQAWSAGAVVLLVETMLGLFAAAPRNTLVVDPVLPSWLPTVTLHDIQVGTSRASLRFERGETGRTEVEVLDGGGLTVLRPPAIPQGCDRTAAALRAVLAPSTCSRL